MGLRQRLWGIGRCLMRERHVRQCTSCGRAFAELSGGPPRCPDCGNSDTVVISSESTMQAAVDRARKLSRDRTENAA